MGVPYINVTNSTPVSPAFPSLNNITLSGATTVANNLQMYWPTDFQTSPNPAVNNVVAYNMPISPTANATYTITLPIAYNTSVGTSFIIWNRTANSFQLLRSDGSLLLTIGNAGAYYVFLNSNVAGGNPDPIGTWFSFPYAAGMPSITSVGIVQDASGNLVVGGIPALPLVTAGSLSFTLGNDLASLTSFGMGGTGYSARIANNTWALRQILGTDNQIVTTNPLGIAGDTVIALANDLVGTNSMEIGDILIGTIDDSTITTRNANEDLVLSPLGRLVSTSPLTIQANQPFTLVGSTMFAISFTAGATVANYGLIYPTTVPIIGQILGVTGGAGPYQMGWVAAPAGANLPVTNNAIARFFGTTGTIQNSLVSIDNVANITGALSYQAANGANTATITNASITTNGNNSFSIIPGGAGRVSLSGFAFPASAGISNPVNGWSTNILTIDGTTMQWAALANKNLFVNGNFSISKLGNTFPAVADNAYICDGWKVKSNGNGIFTATPQNVVGGGPAIFNTTVSYLRMTTTVANTKFGIVQMLSNLATVPTYSSRATFYAYIRPSNLNANVKIMMVAWTGAPDAVDTTTMIGAWNASNTLPAAGANWTFTGVSANVTNTLAWNAATIPGQAVANNYRNIGLFVWDDSALLPIGATIDVTVVKCEPGAWYTGYIPADFYEENERCLEYVQSSYPLGTAPATAATYTNDILFNTPANIPNQAVYSSIIFPKQMAFAPTVNIYSPVTGGANILGNVSPGAPANFAANSCVITAIGSPAGSVFQADTTGFSVYNNSGAPIVVGTNAGFHWTANGTFF